MKTIGVVNKIELEMLNNMNHICSFENQFFLYDNMNEHTATDAYHSEKLACLYPFKLNFTIFIVCVEGASSYSISSREYFLEAGHVLLIDPYIVIEGFSPHDDFKALIFAFSTDSFISEHNTKSFMLIRSHLISPYKMEVNSREMNTIEYIYQFLRDVVRADDWDAAFKRDAIFGGLLLLGTMAAQKLSKLEGGLPNNRQWSKNGIMSRFLSELGAHCTEQRTVSWYADKLFISPKYFAQLVYKESGRYAKDWIRDYVIREAKTMLGNRNFTVQEVSNALHFQNASFFGKYFKKATGMSPKEYVASI